ncbi:PadR family transcriptional regulator [Pseudoclavibacter endophyticus]|uniref:PadR family transcriptional regulator n=1 Tax=Pseudoclavibacter endophyticus TaxID=1778590 RepID=A0A6H9WJR7_9MICO|nr:PadR family transcriptional regulator [Pseudoclavibacter endophyticus]GGA65566.1 PadR family transcriptional regulator [Pseudoclavibacter endophyticus]
MTPPVFAHGRLRLYLLALLNEQPRHGYELIQALTERFDGTYAPSAGTIYPRLAKLEAEGLVTKEVDGRKTIYRITDEGRREVESRADELADIESDVDNSVRRLAQELRDDLTVARDKLRSEFSAFRERQTGDEGSTWGSDFGKKASMFAHRAAEAATAGWSAGESQHRSGADIGASASAAFHAASGTFTTGEGVRDAAGGDGSPTDDRPRPQDAPTPPDETAASGDGTPSGGPAGTGESAPDGSGPDTSIARRADLSLDRFRQDVRQDLRRAEAEGRVTDDVLALIDAELSRVRDLLHHVLGPRDNR